jgi:hypothetical protein
MIGTTNIAPACLEEINVDNICPVLQNSQTNNEA